jgi:hypothetical protein
MVFLVAFIALLIQHNTHAPAQINLNTYYSNKKGQICHLEWSEVNGDLIKPIQECPIFDIIENLWKKKRKLKPQAIDKNWLTTTMYNFFL